MSAKAGCASVSNLFRRKDLLLRWSQIHWRQADAVRLSCLWMCRWVARRGAVRIDGHRVEGERVVVVLRALQLSLPDINRNPFPLKHRLLDFSVNLTIFFSLVGFL